MTSIPKCEGAVHSPEDNTVMRDRGTAAQSPCSCQWQWSCSVQSHVHATAPPLTETHKSTPSTTHPSPSSACPAHFQQRGSLFRVCARVPLVARMKFKLFGELDAPDWLLREIEVLSRMVRVAVVFLYPRHPHPILQSAVKLRLLMDEIVKHLAGQELDVRAHSTGRPLALLIVLFCAGEQGAALHRGPRHELSAGRRRRAVLCDRAGRQVQLPARRGRARGAAARSAQSACQQSGSRTQQAERPTPRPLPPADIARHAEFISLSAS